ncbi:crotonyl-CoA carboxylase/reductase [Rhodovulum sulfidophilum]|uniref:Crotonyl-CoA carboxylase/reductase n=1 Tax=Rhodovulum sulfidophilum TaxID=35806 RepID=A0ABS1RRW6_RHOSU|nr:crotonyl-CoA carboxylase/reductase [Rhodovulum sulfidophilum]MBL3608807.1 crotonyl-CoA carboxylase/reductase [Rhodovulum sulfidophilum]MCE8457633.1 crotonyl-CoA carboxylase/reductase [Rhodovulum sulfidophilum]
MTLLSNAFPKAAGLGPQIEALLADPAAKPEAFAALPLPTAMRALVIDARDEARTMALPEAERDPAQTLRLREVPLPPMAGDEVLIAVMAAGLNYNSVWSSMFMPGSPFDYLRRFGSFSPRNGTHVRDYMVLGSDAAGVVLRVGSQVTNCKPGDEVCVHPGVVNDHAPECHEDDLLSPQTRAWGFETNFGAFADFTVVRASQILPKPRHLSWAEAASLPLVNGTVYRMLIGSNGARMHLGESVLIWGAAGGLGLLACQYVLRGGGQPVCVVSSEDRAEILRRIGVQAVVNRSAAGISLWTRDGAPHERGIARLRGRIRAAAGDPSIDIVFEHPGAETFWASVALLRHGGRVVTCGSTSGHEHRYDNRRLWMHVKSIIGSHGANYHEAWQANRLVCRGLIHPVLTDTGQLADGIGLVRRLRDNLHIGKIAMLCQAAAPRDGIRDPGLRRAAGVDPFLQKLMVS